jgi:sugar phosphate isomerase/epimerase
MDDRLRHLHLHDNDRSGDRHLPMGRGTFDFEALFVALRRHAPDATLSLEIEGTMEEKMRDVRALADRFAS